MRLLCGRRRRWRIEKVERAMSVVERLQVEMACCACWEVVMTAYYGFGLLVVLQWQGKERVGHDTVDVSSHSGAEIRPRIPGVLSFTPGNRSRFEQTASFRLNLIQSRELAPRVFGLGEGAAATSPATVPAEKRVNIIQVSTQSCKADGCRCNRSPTAGIQSFLFSGDACRPVLRSFMAL